jgi:hypothetical protein
VPSKDTTSVVVNAASITVSASARSFSVSGTWHLSDGYTASQDTPESTRFDLY